MKRLMILAAALCIVLLSACTPSTVDSDRFDESEGTQPSEPNTTASGDTEPTREIIGTTPAGDPIYSDQDYVPEPYYFDGNGVKYVLVEGTIDEYYVDEDYQEIVETPESSAFTQIAYCPYRQELHVQFRNSGAWYVYFNVEPETWSEFKEADSKGGFFNEYIKGQYACQKQ